jgi:Ca2+-transporting ATPase
MALISAIPAAILLGDESAQSTAEADRIRRLALLASEPPAGDGSRFVDPMDLALWQAVGHTAAEAEQRFSFDSTRRLASGLTHASGSVEVGVKGAPESVLDRAAGWRSGGQIDELSGGVREKLLEAAGDLAAQGGRVLAVGSRSLSGMPAASRDEIEKELVFEGLLVFSDRLRPEVPGAVRELRAAGVNITVITGDQAATAAAIAREAGLEGLVFTAAEADSWSDEDLAAKAAKGAVFARARPEDKLRIVRATQAAGEVVAVTGDGVNDAPALEAAAIGVAMGRVGSDVAREAADLVLTDDNFATLALATGEGRRLYENLRKAVRYYLAVKLALITVTLVAAVSGVPLPFAPVQIVILELFMDLGASIAFVNQAAEADEMRRPPRDPRARFLDRSMLAGIISGGLTLAVVSGGAFLIGLPILGLDGARTLALVSWLVGHAMLGIVMGWERRPVSLADLFANQAMLGWVGAALAFALSLVLLPAVGGLLHAGRVPIQIAALAIAGAVLVPLWLEVAKRRDAA